MKKYRKKEIVEAVQWFKIGDHPDVIEMPERYVYYIPVLEGATGFLKIGLSGYFMFPGDYIVKDQYGDVYRYSEEMFNKLFEEIEKDFCDKSCGECEHESEDCVMLENNDNNN